jgi:AraC family transcriptional regulator
LNSLARQVHCSAAQLGRIFLEQTGFSIHCYQQHIRLRVSPQLLREMPFELADIAAQLGFASHGHFSSVFRRCFGVSPSQFARSRSKILAATFLES